MNAVIALLVILLLVAVGVAVWLFIKQREAAARRPGAGLASLARGVIGAYTGGLATSLGGGGAT